MPVEPDAAILAAEVNAYLHGEVSLLPFEERVLIRLHVMQDVPVAEIAAVMGICAKEAQNLVAVALHRLRGRLAWMRS